MPLLRSLDPAGRELVPVVRLLEAYRKDIVASFANVAAANQSKPGGTGPDGEPLRSARGVPTLMAEQIFGIIRRLPTNRYNPYPAPGVLDGTGRGTLPSLGCGHIGNPYSLGNIGTAPPCVVQRPWELDGAARSYPHLERFRP